MKILYHHRTAADDGQAVHIRELQAAFLRAGHALQEVALVKRQDPANPHRRSLLGAVADLAPGFVREWMEHGYDFAGTRALRAAIGQFKPDFLYERYALSTACGAKVTKETGLPYVVEINSPLVAEVARTRGLTFQKWARRKERTIIQSADLVVVVSGVLRDWAIESGADPRRVLITPNGVDMARYETLRRRRDLIKKYDIEGKRVIGFTGFVRDWHRLDLAMDAMVMKNLQKKNAVLMVVGEGPAIAQLQQRAMELQIEGAVRFCGKVAHAEIPDHVALFDVALVTAINSYASPLKLFEYLAAGVATVVVDQPNLREVLEEGCARFFNRNEPTELARTLEELVTQPEVSRALGAAGKELLRRRDYTWDGNARRVVEAVRGIVEERSREGR